MGAQICVRTEKNERNAMFIVLNSDVHFVQLVVCFINLPACFAPLHFIPQKSLSGTVRSHRLHVQRSKSRPPTSPGGHTILSYILRLSTPSNRKTLPCQLHSSLLSLLFLIAHMFVSLCTLPGDILIAAEICRKCIWLTSRPVVMRKVCFCS